MTVSCCEVCLSVDTAGREIKDYHIVLSPSLPIWFIPARHMSDPRLPKDLVTHKVHACYGCMGFLERTPVSLESLNPKRALRVEILRARIYGGCQALVWQRDGTQVVCGEPAELFLSNAFNGGLECYCLTLLELHREEGGLGSGFNTNKGPPTLYKGHEIPFAYIILTREELLSR